jgi:molecular chaperone Hsp33
LIPGEFVSDSPKSETDKVGEATIRRFIDHEHDAIVVVGDFGPLFAAYLDHVRRWEDEPDGLSQTFMRQGLGAATLHLACRPRGESIGWTINIHNPPTNIFLTGDSTESTVTGRIFTQNVKSSGTSRMYVQISRAGGSPVQSTVEVNGLDLLLIFEQYYEHSEQTPARFFEVTDEEFLMFLALPEAEASWYRALSREQALDIASDDLKPIGETTYRFQCGCNPQKILTVVRSLFEEDPDELFRGDDGVEVLCPRCGRRWWVERSELDGQSSEGADPTVS